MPDTFDADPNKGFVAFPMSVFDLELCPGAFRTLAELCRMANVEGQCWPSLAQLGVRLGRSKAAVSGYISELRSAGILETETQKMANGYNYRLRYTVTFWKSWRKALGKKTECSVKPDERPLRTKNHIHIKQQSPASAGSDILMSAWKKCVGHAPYPDFTIWPDERLIERTKASVCNVQPAPEKAISADIEVMLVKFLAGRNIKPNQNEHSACVEALFNQSLTNTRLNALAQHLDTIWKPHWIKPPTPAQLVKAVRQLPVENAASSEQKLLRSYLRRWEIHQEQLRFTPSTANVAA